MKINMYNYIIELLKKINTLYIFKEKHRNAFLVSIRDLNKKRSKKDIVFSISHQEFCKVIRKLNTEYWLINIYHLYDESSPYQAIIWKVKKRT